MTHLEADGIRCGIHYPVPVHRQPAYQRNVQTPFPLKVTEQLSEDVISLPLYPGLDDKDVNSVVDSLKRYAAS